MILGSAIPAPSFGSAWPVFTELTGGPREYTVRSGDTLMAIAGRLGANWRAVAETNGLTNPNRIYPGQRLRIDTTRIVPAMQENGVVINLSEAFLYYFEEGRLIFQAGVGLGKPGRWRTPAGAFTILKKERHPVWEVPRSIQQEMEAEGRVVLTRVPPGPDNPLGEFWLGLSLPGYGLHGTIEPSSIGQFRSHGCIRMHPEDIGVLFSLVRVGTRVRIIEEPLKIARVNGRVYLEAHPDVYNRRRNLAQEAEAALRKLGVPVDWGRVPELLQARSGVAEVVSPLAEGRSPEKAPVDHSRSRGAEQETVERTWFSLSAQEG